MADDDDDDVPLLNDEAEHLITSDDRPPNVEAVFVVTFDVKDGNMIEFQLPGKQDLSLDGVEYKVLPSGSHQINEDFIYFRHDNWYGLASLARLDANYEDDGAALSMIDQSQRGLKIKSVGILTSTIRSIQSYLPFLQHETKIYLHQSFSDYDRLKQLLTTSNPSVPMPLVPHDSSFADFLQRFGPAIYPLSRLVLLGKRILFYSSPPIGWLCNAVYFTHFLNPSLKPLFFLTVHDLSLLSHEPPFIGCITEPIFKEKTAIYDVYIDCVINKANPEIVFHSYNPVLRTIAKITRYDRQRFKNRITLSEFVNIGQKFFDFFDRHSTSSTPHQISKDDFHSLHLHPNSDRLFISEYLSLHPMSNVTLPQSDSFLVCCC